MKKYLITNGNNYVYKEDNNYKVAKSASLADTFPYKQALGILNNSLPKSMKNYHLEEYSTGTVIDIHKQKEEVKKLIENKRITFDESIIKRIIMEANSIIGLVAFSQSELIENRVVMNKVLSFYDMGISDITHIVGKAKPPAHVRTIIYGIQQDIIDKREDVKQTIQYIDVMIQAHTDDWNMTRLQKELSAVKYVPYKGRTYIYDEIMELLG